MQSAGWPTVWKNVTFGIEYDLNCISLRQFVTDTPIPHHARKRSMHCQRVEYNTSPNDDTEGSIY